MSRLTYEREKENQYTIAPVSGTQVLPGRSRMSCAAGNLDFQACRSPSADGEVAIEQNVLCAVSSCQRHARISVR